MGDKISMPKPVAVGLGIALVWGGAALNEKLNEDEGKPPGNEQCPPETGHGLQPGSSPDGHADSGTSAPETDHTIGLTEVPLTPRDGTVRAERTVQVATTTGEMVPVQIFTDTPSGQQDPG